MLTSHVKRTLKENKKRQIRFEWMKVEAETYPSIVKFSDLQCETYNTWILFVFFNENKD